MLTHYRPALLRTPSGLLYFSIFPLDVLKYSYRLYISLAFGFSLTVSAWIFFRVSGGLFNPAVSLGMALVGVLSPLRACLLVVVQILGGMTVSPPYTVRTARRLRFRRTCLVLAYVTGPLDRERARSLTPPLVQAAGIVQVLTPGPLNVRTTLSPGTSVSRGLFIEMFLTTWCV